jgi:hypothetical protein
MLIVELDALLGIVKFFITSISCQGCNQLPSGLFSDCFDLQSFDTNTCSTKIVSETLKQELSYVKSFYFDDAFRLGSGPTRN